MKLNHTGTIKLETKRLILRLFSLDDSESFYHSITNNQQVRAYFLVPYHETLQETQNMMKHIVKTYQINTYHWAITLKENNTMIGLIRLFNLNEKERTAEIGYALDDKYWNKKYMTEALLVVLDHLFQEVGFIKITAYCMSENKASSYVLKKNHMKYLGKTINGINWEEKNHDILHYALTKEEYFKKNNKVIF